MHVLKLVSDLETPVSTFMKVSKNEDFAFLLESVELGSTFGRHSFIGIGKKDVFFLEKGVLKSSSRNFEYSSSPLKVIKDWLEIFKYDVKHEELPSFRGGAVGFVSYDYIKYIEKIGVRESIFPTFYFIIPEHLIIFDHLKNNVFIVSETPEELAAKIMTPLEKFSKENAFVTEPESNFDREQFYRAVEKAKRYIVDGDIFQVVLSQSFTFKTTLDPFCIYRALRMINPSPYMFYLKFGDIVVLGSSPETMAKVEKNKATVKPIAGTRPRGRTVEEDLKLEEELLHDEKEIAEHVMLVDLGRNDLGRVCKEGSVRVEKKMVIERYSHVMHIVSQVSGEVKEGKDAIDVFEATFPAGTVSGAPKVRAMEIIEELEPTPRGPYAGAVGYFSFPDELGRMNMDSAITIRSFFFKGKQGWIQAGAGIVYDSVPEREYQETLNKLRALFRSLEIAQRIQGGLF
ncbi:anthranilate synthase component I family protein [Thermotoga sp. KOL6]|uniref:anthranilate synthase component I family protein n=1 Tax=Thermotoga sp. KOL6 TaxID=126741 RepID=UPI000C7719F1|nr:anthranilate synthase component I family protein [Thermotoga sp. KOL6]PLV58732.1 anthranilate synthase [Thermotoga sp. KOL6]